ncbi:MAG: DUF115 domain-containing protein [Magnetococcales bacterium]|nr:DUF115 domain-containing protein [Magnetococcales bacterium]
MSHWHGNGAIIERRWPALWQTCIETQGKAGHRIEQLENGALLVDGLHAFSRFDPQNEACLQAERVPRGSTEAYLYGLIGAHLPVHLLAREEMRHLTVVLLNVELFCQTLNVIDHQTWLDDPRVTLTTWREVSTLRSPFATTPITLTLPGRDDTAKKLATRIRTSLEEHFQNRRFLEHPLLMERIRQNARRTTRDPGVETLFGSHPRGTILVAGAGPSLSDHIPLLSRRSPQTPLVAVDAALLPLRREGVLPDIVVTQEHHPLVFTLFQDVEGDAALARVPLVYFPASDPEVLGLWPGPRRVACSHSPAYGDIRRQRERSVLFAAGSVLHPAVDLAVRMGAAKIILVGADFSHPGGMSHAEGCAALRWNCHRDPTLTLPDGQGGEVPTTHALNGMLLELESFIRLHPDVAFFIAGRRGARIHGTRYLDELHAAFRSDARLPAIQIAEQITEETVENLLSAGDADLLVYRYCRAEARFNTLRGCLSPGHAPRAHILARCGAAEVLLYRHGYSQAESLLAEALAQARARALGQREAIILRIAALRGTAQLRMQTGRAREAADLLEDARAMTYGLGDPRERARTGRTVAEFLRMHGRLEAAKQELLEARSTLRRSEKTGSPLPFEDARCLMDLGHLTAGAGTWSETREYFSQALTIYWQHGEKTAAALARQALFVLRQEMQQALQLHPGNCRGHLVQAVRLYRLGQTLEGGEAIRRLIDCILRRLDKQGGIDPEQTNPLLTRILEAQQRGDTIQVADDLAHRLDPLWFR